MRFSLKSKISLLFLFALLSVTIFSVTFYYQKDIAQETQLRRFVYGALSGAYDRTAKKINLQDLNESGFEKIEDEEFAQKIMQGRNILDTSSGWQRRNPAAVFAPQIIPYRSYYYAVIYIDKQPSVFRMTPFKRNNIIAYMFFFTMSGILVLLYFAILHSIKPLTVLRKKIREFSDGNDEIDCKIKGNDEIAEVANEFDAAVKKIRSLREARQLFLRNIMHEFKTPITRGKLSIEMLERENPYREVLSKVFLRQENLLSEFMRIEQLGTGEMKLDKDKYQLQDIVDYALDIIGENARNIDVQISPMRVNADFDLLSTALKNLLDNALLYSEDKKAAIEAKNGLITISNFGKKLEFSLDDYKKPFFLQGKKQKESRGFGFGLFISLNIFELHDIKCSYKHEHGKSIFELKLPEN